MDADWIITAFVLIDTVLEQFDHRSHALAHVPCVLSARSAISPDRSRFVASIDAYMP